MKPVPFRLRRAAVVLLALTTALGAAQVPADAADPEAPSLPGLPALPTVPGLPIPSLPTDLLVPRFIGAPATARPLEHPEIPRNPHLAPNGASGMHNDAYSSDAYAVSGPLGDRLRVTSASYGVRECATIAFDSRGRIVGLCGGLEGFVMMVIDPVSLEPIDQLQISSRNLLSGANPLSDICGGTYFFLDDADRAVVTTTRRTLAEVQVAADGSLTRVVDHDLAAVVPEDDCLVATMPDWTGLVWWVTQDGRVGTVDRATGRVAVHQLPAGEGIFNSISGDETGGVYVVTTHALYRLDAGAAGAPEVTWRQAYDRGTRVKPGMLSQGSGTTPTLIGDRWIVIADNADPKTRVIVYDRTREGAGAELCSVPVLPDNAGTTENSLVAAGNSVIIENNYGYAGPQSTLLGRTTTPGIARVLIEPDGCRLAWTNPSVAPTSVPKASLGNGLVYAYTKPPRTGLLDVVDPWYVTAIDIRTGRTAWSVLTGTGIQWNNHYSSIYLGPDGTLYVATLAGLVRIADGG